MVLLETRLDKYAARIRAVGISKRSIKQYNSQMERQTWIHVGKQVL
jgi:hypothetical protein